LVAQIESSRFVCYLRKSLYGLKLSPRAWFGKFSSVLQKFGMTCSEADDHHGIYLIIYVDDIVLTNIDHHGISQMKQHICHHFQIKILANLNISLALR